jgi:uncharacterized membrane protein YbhN (UPF0104 family)
VRLRRPDRLSDPGPDLARRHRAHGAALHPARPPGPLAGARIADKLRALIEGFKVLHEPRDLLPFLAETILYWGSNGLGMWLLARGMGLDISLPAAYAAMAFTGVLISLPNSPGLVGQFEAG